MYSSSRYDCSRYPANASASLMLSNQIFVIHNADIPITSLCRLVDDPFATCLAAAPLLLDRCVERLSGAAECEERSLHVTEDLLWFLCLIDWLEVVCDG